MKNIFLVVTVTLLASRLMAQDDGTFTSFQQDQVKASPNAANMANLDTDLYTGRINITVPLFTATDGALSLPLSLQYKTTGIPVDELPSWVGLGWNLNAGGAIVRTVKGLRDEAKYPTAETSPDEFNYNFLGQSGTFFLNKDWTASTNRKIKIEFSINPLQSSGSSTINYIFSYWKITIEDGTQFYFRYIEYSTYSVDGNAIPSGWYLTEVVSADENDRIYLEYQTSSTEINKVYVNDETYAMMTIDNRTNQVYTSDHGYVSINPTYLTRIITTSHIISFNGAYSALFNRTQLQSITVNRKDGSLIKNIALSYVTYGHTNTRYMLASVGESGSDNKDRVHTFSYNMNSMAPVTNERGKLSQGGIDHWGYYNGSQINYNTRIANAPFIPSSLTNGVTLRSISREPNGAFVGYGSLNKITYPTGGYTAFTFEPNDYSTTSGGQTFTTIQQGSGLRIAKITQHDGINPDVVKTYSYKNSDESSTGVIAYLPTYSFSYSFGGNELLDAYSSTIWKNSALFPIDIGYSMVTEQVSDGGSTVFHYTTLLDYPFSDFINIGSVAESDVLGTLDGGGFGLHNGTLPNPFQTFKGRYFYMVGQLTEKDIINTNTAFTEKIAYTLSAREFSHISGNYSIDIFWNRYGLSYTIFSQNYSIPIGRCEVTVEERTKTYTDSNGAQQTDVLLKNYYYDDTSLQLSSTREDISNGNRRYTSYTYPLNYAIDPNATLSDEVKGIQLLQNRNVINAVIEKNVFEYDDESLTSRTQISADLITYKKDTPLPDRSFHYNMLSSVPFVPTSVSNGSLVIAGGYEEMQQNTYNAFGNLSYVKNRSDMPVSYLWDNHQSLMTGKAANVVLNETDEALAGTINILGDANSTSPFSETEYAVPNGNNVGQFTVGNNQYAILSGKINTSHPSSISYFVLGLQDANGKIAGVPKYFMNDSGSEESYSLLYSLPPGTYSVFYYYKHSADSRTSGLPSGLSFSLAVNLVKPHTQVYYNGFEADIASISTTDWKSGVQCHQGAFTIPLPYQAGSYILSYWQKPSGQTDWSRHEETLTITGSGTPDKTIGTSDGLIDDVRITPAGGLMTTYTFDPAFGPTSVTDINHQVTYYEYDGFGRVSVIRDNNGKIVKSYVYEYKR